MGGGDEVRETCNGVANTAEKPGRCNRPGEEIKPMSRRRESAGAWLVGHVRQCNSREWPSGPPFTSPSNTPCGSLPRRQQAQPRSVTRGEAVAENRKQPSDRGRSGGRNNRHRYGPAWHSPRAQPSRSGPGRVTGMALATGPKPEGSGSALWFFNRSKYAN